MIDTNYYYFFLARDLYYFLIHVAARDLNLAMELHSSKKSITFLTPRAQPEGFKKIKEGASTRLVPLAGTNGRKMLRRKANRTKT
jgi:hypothetical protein